TDVRAAGEDRSGLAVVARQHERAEGGVVPLADLLAVLLLEVTDRPVRPPGGHDRRGREGRLAGDLLVLVDDLVGAVEVDPRSLVLGVGRGLRRRAVDLLQLLQALYAVRVGQRRAPTA